MSLIIILQEKGIDIYLHIEKVVKLLDVQNKNKYLVLHTCPAISISLGAFCTIIHTYLYAAGGSLL